MTTSTRSTAIQNSVLDDLRRDFRNEVQGFLQQYGFDRLPAFQIEPGNKEATPVSLVTGISFTPYDADKHGNDPHHALYTPVVGGLTYMMNNTAVVLKRLLDAGERVVAHSKDPALLQQVIDQHPNVGNARVAAGDLGDPGIHTAIYGHLAAFAKEQPIAAVRMALYQSFAQSSGMPFKPMYKEAAIEVEKAANKRLRFVYNMAAMGYDLLTNRGQDHLRVVSLSALAGQRATYGLIADAADKFMNELGWRTFHLEANASTGKPVSVYMINPGITTACDVYINPEVRSVVNRESVADGFPMADDILTNQAPLPRLSSHDIGHVAELFLTSKDDANPNNNLPAQIKGLLYGGYTPDELKRRFNDAFRIAADGIDVGSPGTVPEHLLAAATSYGKLPDRIRPGDFRRISLTPLGQTF